MDRKGGGLFQKVKENLTVVTSIIAIVGVLVSILNFYILSRIEPLADRVKAVEGEHSVLKIQHDEQQKIMERFLIVESKVEEIDKKLDKISTKLDTLFVPR